MATQDRIVDMTRGYYRRQWAGFINGRRICSVSEGAEAWFWRVHALADDFGNGPADRHLVWLEGKGRRSINESRVAKYMAELAAANLIALYSERGEDYYHIIGFLILQPANRDGRRYRRYPAWPGESGESSRGAAESHGTPAESKANVASYSHEHEHEYSQKNSHEHEKDDHDSQTPAAGSGSGEVSSSVSVSGSEEQDPKRQLARQVWIVGVKGLWAKGGAQKKADHTSSHTLFDELVWPDGMSRADGQARANQAMGLITRAARNGDVPMAWLTKELRKLETTERVG